MNSKNNKGSQRQSRDAISQFSAYTNTQRTGVVNIGRVHGKCLYYNISIAGPHITATA